MFSIICDLFISYGFLATEAGSAKLFSMNETDGKNSFWLVVQESDLDSLLEKQPTLFSTCTEVCQHPSLEKNLSMLVLWDTGGNLEIGTMKRKVMAVEEDPYFFKKYVLYFSSSERDALNAEVDNQKFNDFLKTNIASQDIFTQYKENPMSQSWQSLIYRISIKIPFIEINIDASEGLSSLFEKNQEKIEAESLTSWDHLFFEKYDSKTTEEMKEIDAKKILSEVLMMTVGEGAGGDTD